VRPIAGGKVEIVVDGDADFNDWLNGLEDQLRPLTAKLQG
jgi:hypothetical protein